MTEKAAYIADVVVEVHGHIADLAEVRHGRAECLERGVVLAEQCSRGGVDTVQRGGEEQAVHLSRSEGVTLLGIDALVLQLGGLEPKPASSPR